MVPFFESHPMLQTLKIFKDDEAGAVTVDWVVLTAAVVGLSTLLVIELRGGSSGVTGKVETYLTNVEPGSFGADD